MLVNSFKSMEIHHFIAVDNVPVQLRDFTSRMSFLVVALCTYP